MEKSRLIKRKTYFYQNAVDDQKYTKWGLKIPIKFVTTHGWNLLLKYWK